LPGTYLGEAIGNIALLIIIISNCTNTHTHDDCPTVAAADNDSVSHTVDVCCSDCGTVAKR